MRNTAKFLLAGAFALAVALCAIQVMEIAAYAQAQPARPAQPAQQQPQQTQQPTFRSTAELVTTDVIVRDAKNDQFMADLKPTDFEVFEDGVKQELASMVLIHGGRAYNTLAPPPAPLQEAGAVALSLPGQQGRGPLTITEIQAGSPAVVAGLQVGDVILSADGRTFDISRDLTAYVRSRAGRVVDLTVRRGGQEVDVPVTPRALSDAEEAKGLGAVGFSYEPDRFVEVPPSASGPAEAAWEGFTAAGDLAPPHEPSAMPTPSPAPTPCATSSPSASP